ncbi:hypothetical protein J4H86_25110 [Spiractinospora alimapuensis]|uniref:hypothetical protein n=1 Tax=Spiractinospora alimapuensis TaxID=2820884 RepID=UPI001F18ECBB|nr:hypothetical protein [Spiractinospora alimapuensis]QVQ51978.1 hypothetical protein J4H86_25110 [Spiractinospora alimapuensis]
MLDTLSRSHRVHVTRRDGEDLYLTTARHERHRDETVDVAARFLVALSQSAEGELMVRRAFPDVFPWVRHLSDAELGEFASDLISATRDAAELDVHAALHRIIIEWRATARILADPELTEKLTTALPDEDHGCVAEP